MEGAAGNLWLFLLLCNLEPLPHMNYCACNALSPIRWSGRLQSGVAAAIWGWFSLLMISGLRSLFCHGSPGGLGQRQSLLHGQLTYGPQPGSLPPSAGRFFFVFPVPFHGAWGEGTWGLGSQHWWQEWSGKEICPAPSSVGLSAEYCTIDSPVHP